ncbi:hypothetical protein EAY30_22980, partial [Vibrio anguillarum]
LCAAQVKPPAPANKSIALMVLTVIQNTRESEEETFYSVIQKKLFSEAHQAINQTISNICFENKVHCLALHTRFILCAHSAHYRANRAGIDRGHENNKWL